MSTWSLSELLSGLHEDIRQRLEIARKTFGDSTTKGDASERVWIELLQSYLPRRYWADRAHVVDSNDTFSEQIDVVVFDRQYTPFIFNYENQIVIPAESVYAVFEAKQSINAGEVAYAQKKVASVRRLHRTSLPIPTASGTNAPKALQHIFGGVLTFESDWNPPLGQPLLEALVSEPEGRLDLGCAAAHGVFGCDAEGCFSIATGGKPATAFLLELIARLQTSATVPLIDIRACASWLTR